MWIRIGIIPSVIGVIVGIIIIAPSGRIIIPTVLIIWVVYITMNHRGMMVVIMPRVTTIIVTSSSILGVDRINCTTETIDDIFILVMRRGRLEHSMC